MAARVAYFVNLESLFTSSSSPGPNGNAADNCGPAIFVERLQFLHQLLREDAEVLCFCTRPSDVGCRDAVELVCDALALPPSEAQDLARHGEAKDIPNGYLGCSSSSGEVQTQLQIVQWLATYASLTPCRVKVVAVEHLCGDGSIDHTSVLQSLRRLLGGSPLTTPDCALPLLAEQVAHLLFDNHAACVDKATLADLLDPFEESGHSELYRNVVHPIVVVPSMVLLDYFASIMPCLVTRGLACPANRQGQVPLEVSFSSDTRTLRLYPLAVETDHGHEAGSIGGQAQTTCWRLLVQKEVVAEARKALNLFQLKGLPPPVPHDATVMILTEAWKAAVVAWSVSSSVEAFTELFLAARFLLLNGHDVLPETWALSWAPLEGHVMSDELDGTVGDRCILLTLPAGMSSSFPSLFSSSDTRYFFDTFPRLRDL